MEGQKNIIGWEEEKEKEEKKEGKQEVRDDYKIGIERGIMI